MRIAIVLLYLIFSILLAELYGSGYDLVTRDFNTCSPFVDMFVLMLEKPELAIAKENNSFDFIPETEKTTSLTMEDFFDGRGIKTVEDHSKLYIGGKPQLKEKRGQRKKAVQEIIEYQIAFESLLKDNSSLIKKLEYNRKRVQKALLRIDREKAHRIIEYMVAEGILLKTYKNSDGVTHAVIVPEGNHKFNKRAKEFYDNYNGLRLTYHSSFTKTGSYNPRLHEININDDVILSMDPKSSAIGHELRHATNPKETDFGYSTTDDWVLPGNYIGYEKYMSHDEPQQYSYSIREDSKRLQNEVLKKTDLSLLKDEFYKLYVLIDNAYGIGELYQSIAELVSNQIQQGMDPVFVSEYTGPRKSRYQEFAHFSVGRGYKITEHYIPVFLPRSASRTQKLEYVKKRIQHMEKEAENYLMQFKVALLAAQKLLKTSTPREAASVLQGIIGITRPHFWKEDSFVILNFDKQVDVINAIIANRWRHFSYLDNKNQR